MHSWQQYEYARRVKRFAGAGNWCLHLAALQTSKPLCSFVPPPPSVAPLRVAAAFLSAASTTASAFNASCRHRNSAFFYGFCSKNVSVMRLINVL
jgi:hypothetical protein